MAAIGTEVLETLIPFRDLPQEAVRQLAEVVELEDHPARSVIFRKGGDDGWTRYVLSGAVVLVDDDGNRRTLTGTGDAGVYPEPLADDEPYRHHALASTEVRLIRLPRQEVEAVLAATRLPEYDVGVVNADSGDAGEGLFYRLFEDLMEDRLDVPSMPDMALKVRHAVEEQEAGAADVARIIQADPPLAARLIQTANSAAYGGQTQVDSLAPAITRLGLRTTREVVMAVTLKSVFSSDQPLINQRMTELWMHSALIAAISQVMARRLHGFDAGRAMLAGLVHDIGVIPMLTNAGHYPELVSNPARLQQTVAAYRGQVGAMILRRWNFPDDMVNVPLAAEEWHRDADSGDYGDLVMLAQLQALADEPGADVPAPAETAAYRRLGMAKLGPGDGGSLLAEAREEIAQVQQVLLGH
ncbi:HDOD domain-containing protein [Aquisalimonas lutea]|uniref:HDOD domain-containing protein n=1 Tax=Aquisalimonas lutea TaxID=1327750 RepID=UPI0025B53FAF|nr:HDOD domain-containing protein [Aquisalimonas lutea]MDN3517091.1 HDOD domain-containing protein [Aquisalimonas lutea]